MRLVSLDIEGFKSFADKTHLEFADGITGIIGENGHGKTCIVESVLWVLGAQAPSALRSKDMGMKGVIFWGTRKDDGTLARQRARFAQVSIVFSNEDRVLAVDSSEVEITRRLSVTRYRSDDDFDVSNEYFINKSPAKLKEVNALLANTGIGKNSYSVLQQGEIDAILKAKPQDRRAIFEEAASISGYRQEEKEAQAKLLASEGKLSEVNSRFSYLKGRHDRLKEQAETAIKYRADTKEMRALQDKLAVLELGDLEKRKSECVAALEKDQKRLSVLARERKAMEERRDEGQKLLSDLREGIAVINGEIESAKSLLAVKQESLDTLLRAVEDCKRRHDSAESRRLETKAAENAILERLDSVKKDVASCEAEALSASKMLESANKGLDETSSLFSQSDEEQAHLEKEKESLERELYGTYLEFVSKAHRVISLICDAIGDGGASASRREVEKAIIGRLEELLRLLDEEKGRIEGESLARAKAAASDVARLFGEYVQSLGDISGLEKDAKAIAEAKRADEAVSPLFSRMESISSSLVSLKDSMRELSAKKSAAQMKLIELKDRKAGIEAKLMELKYKGFAAAESLKAAQVSSKEADAACQASKRDLDDGTAKALRIRKETDALSAEIKRKIAEKGGMEKKREKAQADLIGIAGQDQSDMEKLKDTIAGLKVKIESLDEQIGERSRDYFESEGMDIRDLAERVKIAKGDSVALVKRKVLEIKARIKGYGNPNLSAAEEFEEVKAEYDRMKAQLDDYTKAKDDLKGVLSEIQAQNKTLFMDAFKRINDNFRNFYSALTQGGDASIRLEDSQDELEAGVEIYACPPGKAATYVSSLSGGEKTIATLALFFAIYQTKPAPFCFLDEPGAALSAKNAALFLAMLRDFKDTSQFFMIVHDVNMLKGADAMIGVYQAPNDKGVSKVVGLDMEIGPDGTPKFKSRRTGRQVDIKLEG